MKDAIPCEGVFVEGAEVWEATVVHCPDCDKWREELALIRSSDRGEGWTMYTAEKREHLRTKRTLELKDRENAKLKEEIGQLQGRIERAIRLDDSLRPGVPVILIAPAHGAFVPTEHNFVGCHDKCEYGPSKCHYRKDGKISMCLRPAEEHLCGCDVLKGPCKQHSGCAHLFHSDVCVRCKEKR